MPILRRVNKDFFKKWTSDMAYVLGFFAADGYITLNKRGANFWCIQINDKKLLVTIKKIVEAEHKISARERKGNQRTSYRLQIGSKEMCNDLRRLGMKERKTKSLAIPRVPIAYLAEFVRGYFDGDGNVWTGLTHKERNTPNTALLTVFTSCSISFLKKLHKKLLKAGIHGGSISKTKNNYARLQFSTSDSLRLYDFMYNQSDSLRRGLFLERKKRVFEKYKRMRE